MDYLIAAAFGLSIGTLMAYSVYPSTRWEPPLKPAGGERGAIIAGMPSRVVSGRVCDRTSLLAPIHRGKLLPLR